MISVDGASNFSNMLGHAQKPRVADKTVPISRTQKDRPASSNIYRQNKTYTIGKDVPKISPAISAQTAYNLISSRMNPADNIAPGAMTQQLANLLARPTTLRLQNQLASNRRALSQSIERLTTGQRINHAKDGAAGQAIANLMTANINGLRQAVRNAQAGQILLNTLDKALSGINEYVQQIRTLSVHAANGTLSMGDRSSLQQQLNLHLEAIDSIANQAHFNGIKLLDGSYEPINIQLGADDEQYLTLRLKPLDSGELGLESLTINGYEGGLTLVKDGSHFDGIIFDRTHTASHRYANQLVFINTGEKAELTFQNGQLYIDERGQLFAEDDLGDLYSAHIKGSHDANNNARLKIFVDTDHVARANTQNPIQLVDQALDIINSMRSHTGASSNRLDSAMQAISIAVNNLLASRSRILDVDYAHEVSHLSSTLIQNSASLAVLAQANQSSGGVSPLLI